jgi:N-acyl homoserine lactone hydrolase
MKLYVLQLGFMEMDNAWLILNYSAATVDEPNKPAQWIRVPILSFLIVHEQGTILFDTGCDPRGMAEQWPEYTRSHFPFYQTEEDHIENRLAQLGYKVSDIDYVVASHLHYDHAGNVKIFKKSKVLVNKNELAHALTTTHIKPQFNTAYSKYDINVEGIRWQPVEDDFELMPGIEVVNLEGHSAGILGLIVNLEKTGTVICPSDALYSPLNYGPPARLPGSIYDSLGFYRTVDKIRRLQKKHNAKILYSHNLEQYDQEMPKIPEFLS